jgi:hypothetical protein
MTTSLINFTLKKDNYQVEEDEVGGAYSPSGEERTAYRSLVRKPGGKRPLGRPRRRWLDNIKMDLVGIEWGVDWIDLSQNRSKWRALVNVV